MTDLTTLPAVVLRDRLAMRTLSTVEVVAAFLDRIEATNPTINALVSLRDRAELMAEAAARDKGPVTGPLHGLPMAPKDLSDTAGLRTTYGSPAFADHVPLADSHLAARLRAAGAIFLGKSNTPEFGLGSHTYNPVHGPTRNPYRLDRSAGGSSGGAAAALAARMLPLADGSDMMGSLRNPAGWNNVYGLRPSYGMVAQEPRGDTFHKQLSTAGPMAHNPADLRLLLDVLAAPEPLAPHHAPRQRPLPRTIRWIGDWDGRLAMEAGVTHLCRAALDVLAKQGLTVEGGCPATDGAALWQSWIDLRSWVVAGELGPLHDDPKTGNRLKPEAVWEIERGRAMTGRAIHAASVIRSDWFREVEAENVLWAIPSAQIFPFPVQLDWPKTIANRSMDTYHRWMECVVPASLIGAPAISLPAGFRDGLPMGVQIFGPRGCDHALIAMAETYHAATDWPGRHPIAL